MQMDAGAPASLYACSARLGSAECAHVGLLFRLGLLYTHADAAPSACPKPTRLLWFCDPTGSDCVVVKKGLRVCGSGAVLANAPLVQDKSYWEAKIQAVGV